VVANHVQPCAAIKTAESRLRLKYEFPTLQLMHAYGLVKIVAGVDLISDALPFIIALIVGGVLVFTAVAAAVIVNLLPRPDCT
jgi:hypothetical protein